MFLHTIVWGTAVISFSMTLLIKSCKVFWSTGQVGWSKSHCFSLEKYRSPSPTYKCVLQCRSTQGCVAVITDSMETTLTCCTLIEKNIHFTEAPAIGTVIHDLEYSVCFGSDWTGQFLSHSYQIQSYFSIKLRLPGLGHNCSYFSGTKQRFRHSTDIFVPPNMFLYGVAKKFP